jgi:GST-like protein
MTIRLHGFISTNPQKVRLALEELGLAYEYHHVDLYTGAQKTEEYREIHPRQKVPALEIDGAVVWESDACLAYLGDREGRLWPTDVAKANALNWLFLEAGAFQDLASVFFFNRVVLRRIGKSPDSDRMAKAHHKLTKLFDLLAQPLEQQPYLLGNFSLVDCAYAPWLPVLDLEEWPALEAWRDRLMARPSWAACDFQYGLQDRV